MIVFFRLVKEDMVGDQRPRPLGRIVVTGEDIDASVGITGGTNPGDPPEVPPGPPSDVGKGERADLGRLRVRRERRVDPRGESAEDLAVISGLSFLENPLQGPPRAITKRNPGDDLEQAGPGIRAVVFPERRENLVKFETVGKRNLGIGSFERLDLFDAIVTLLVRRLRLEKCLGTDLGEKLGKRRCSLAEWWLRGLVGLAGQDLDEPDEVGIIRVPGEADVIQAKAIRHDD
jgi:hypothetical protein